MPSVGKTPKKNATIKQIWTRSTKDSCTKLHSAETNGKINFSLFGVLSQNFAQIKFKTPSAKIRIPQTLGFVRYSKISFDSFVLGL